MMPPMFDVAPSSEKKKKKARDLMGSLAFQIIFYLFNRIDQSGIYN